MIVLHPLSDFISSNFTLSDARPNYYYEGRCPQTGEILRLPRTPLAEAIANSLMQQLEQNYLYSHEGKMYGILLVELPNGEQKVIKAFSLSAIPKPCPLFSSISIKIQLGKYEFHSFLLLFIKLGSCC